MGGGENEAERRFLEDAHSRVEPVEGGKQLRVLYLDHTSGRVRLGLEPRVQCRWFTRPQGNLTPEWRKHVLPITGIRA